MRRNTFTRVAVWPAIAAAAFVLFLTALFALADSAAGRNYAELPDPAMRVGIPAGYEYCDASQLSPPFYLICDRHRETDLAASPRAGLQYDARYYVWVFDADASLTLGYDPTRGIESARKGISASYFATRSFQSNGELIEDPTLQVVSTIIDGHESLEFQATIRVSTAGPRSQRHLIAFGLDDGRLVEVFNDPYGISPTTDASNFREIVQGIKFHRSK